ncbi:efflux RND transporter periplasmic adaptor subunit [Colwelliaceae bacterium 6441]
MSLRSVVSNKLSILLLGIIIGVLFLSYFPKLTLIHLSQSDQELTLANEGETNNTSQKANEPLYWVAPMDDNYRRDEPGKSPMGMDLVPVYASNDADQMEGEGTVFINPSVINNLGVRSVNVKFSQLNKQINTVGFITYNEDKLSHIHPRINGWVEKLYVKATGDLVEKGQPLYELYSPELVNAQEEYLLTLSAKDKRLIEASERRLKALHIPQKVIDEIKSTNQVKQNVMFTAPQSGIIKDLNVREGFYVDLGTRLFSIGDLSEVWVEAEIFERQYRKVHQGDKVSMNLDYLPEHVWQGEVDYIYPILDAKTRTVRVRLRFQNPDFALKPNMFAQVTIHDTDNKKHILIPKEALIRTGDQDRVVLALGEGRFKSLAVKVGNQDNTHIEVLSGLNQHDKVVVSAQFLIDSESSKTSDFIRMSSLDNDLATTQQVWTQGEIKNVAVEQRKVTLQHQAIDEWDWPEMTMDFVVDDNVEMKKLTVGMSLSVEISLDEYGNYTLSDIDTNEGQQGENLDDNENTQAASARVVGVINSIDIDNKVANISREAIEKWGREAATMNFIIADDLSVKALSRGQTIDFTFEIQAGEFVITQLHKGDK